MKAIIAGAVLLSTGAMAHDSHFSNDSCDVDLNAGLSIKNDVITFSKKGQPLYKIVGDKTLVVDGKDIQLSSQQERILADYSIGIRALVPEVKAIAVDAIELASDGVNLAFNELLGEGNDLGRELSTQLYALKDEIDVKFDTNNFSIDEDGTVEGDFLGDEFEERIEAIVEETVQNSMGTLLIAVGQELLLAGGDMDSFEQKMEKFGEQIEYEMESRADVIEKRAESLCYSVEKINDLEEQLKSSISEMPQEDVISVENSHRKKA